MASIWTTIFGLDLGKAQDPAALVMVQACETDLPYIGESWQRFKFYIVRAIKSYPLGTDYVDLVSDVSLIYKKFLHLEPKLVVDATGVGDPIVDLLRRSRITRLHPIKITTGSNQRYDEKDKLWLVAKNVLIANAKIVLRQNRMFIAQGIPQADILVNELRGYVCKVTIHNNETFNARSGEHDDVLMSLVTALWWGERGQRHFGVFT